MSAHIVLRLATHRDSARLLAWRNLPQVAQWMYSDHLIAAEEHARWSQSALTDPRCRYWIIELDGTPVGLANLGDISETNRKASWAYYLAEPATRGKGVGAYVEVFVLDHAFQTLGLNKLSCEVLIENDAVWKMHESFGFVREALYRAHVWKGGDPRDVVGLAILADQWAAARPASVARLREKGFEID